MRTHRKGRHIRPGAGVPVSGVSLEIDRQGNAEVWVDIGAWEVRIISTFHTDGGMTSHWASLTAERDEPLKARLSPLRPVTGHARRPREG